MAPKETRDFQTYNSSHSVTLLFFFAGHLMLVSSHTAVRVSCWFLDFLILLLVSFTLTPFALFTTECILFHLSIVIYFFKMQINEESCLALSLYQHDTQNYSKHLVLLEAYSTYHATLFISLDIWSTIPKQVRNSHMGKALKIKICEITEKSLPPQ